MAAPWSKEEIEYLKKKWGATSIPAIAGHLGRSVNAVKIKAQKAGLRRHLHSGDYITLNQLCKALDVSYSTWSLGMWQRHGMPVKYRKVVNNSFRVIYVRDFWKWAERNKMVIDFSKMERGALGPEPFWVEYKRIADIAAKKYKRTPWTEDEDALFIKMLDTYKYSYREISVALKRTEGAMKRRMKDLRLKQRPVKANNHNPWSKEEEEILISMYYKGYISEIIAERINRSALAINGKIERMVKEGKLRADRYRPIDDSGLGSGVNYKKAIPKEKWPVVKHFLGCFEQYARVANEHGKRLDVNVFLDEYVAIVGQIELRVRRA